MFATVNVVELGLGDAVVDVDAWAKEFPFGLEFVKSSNTSGGLFGNTSQVLGKFAEEVLVLSETVVNGLEQPVFVL